MNEFISSNQETIKSVLKSVLQYDKELKSLSAWWEKIALIGKINSYEIASTILLDMDTTLRKFNLLQERLITSLINEHTRKITFQNTSRCQMAIDVLIRNLFERTADIGFLSKNLDIVEFLKRIHINDADKSFIGDRLQAYINIYSVYQDVLLLKPDGELVFQLSQPSRVGKIKDDFIEEAIKSPHDYVEFFGKSNLIQGSPSNLMYANAVLSDNVVIGVIVLCFRFENELEGIIKHLMSENEVEHFVLTNGAGEIIFAPPHINDPQKIASVSLDSSPKIESFNSKNILKVCVKGQKYQGYSGPSNWHMGSLFPLDKIENNTPSIQKKKDVKNSLITDLSSLIPADLFDVRYQSKVVNDDLQLIVLNGIITAARKKATEFMPVLEEIKKIGENIDSIFDHSIESLFSTIISGQLEGIRLQANLAVDIMDRNLFERANDCRWWGLSNLLRVPLSSSEVDVKSIEETLAKINSLYTVYHTLYVYDDKCRYIAFSENKYNKFLGMPIEAHSGGKDVFQLKTPYEYCVSPFESFDCYQGESTYIYNAALRGIEDQNKIIGGIGIVFDSTVEFLDILNDILPRKEGEVIKGSKALFTTEQGLIISSTSADHTIGEIFLPDIDMSQLSKKKYITTAIRLNDVMYLIGVAKSKGYREYKVEDGYENPILAWVMSPC